MFFLFLTLLFFLILLSIFWHTVFCTIFPFPICIIFISSLYPSLSSILYLAFKTQALAPFIFLFSSSFPLWWRPLLSSNQHFENKSQQISPLYKLRLSWKRPFLLQLKICLCWYHNITQLKVVKCSLYIFYQPSDFKCLSSTYVSLN